VEAAGALYCGYLPCAVSCSRVGVSSLVGCLAVMRTLVRCADQRTGRAAAVGLVPSCALLLCHLQVRFLTAPDPDDPVVKSHYRMIRHFTADDPQPLVPGEPTHLARVGPQ
jgi:hypothetical protein